MLRFLRFIATSPRRPPVLSPTQLPSASTIRISSIMLRLVPRWRHVARFLSSLPEHKQIIMPKVSPTMTMGRLVTWKKQEGDAFEEGEDIADVESDKATMPISAREDGFIARIFVSPDTPDIPLGQVLAITVEEQEFIDAFKNYTPSDAAPSSISSPSRAANSAPDAKPSPNASPSTTPAPVATPAKLYDGPVGPAIMRLLNEFPNLRLSGITPTGPQGRLLKGDVLAAIEDGTAFGRAASTSSSDAVDADTKSETGPSLTTIPSTKTDFTDVPVSSMRRAIAKRLLQSKTTVPHLYASSSYNLNALLALRKRLNAVEPSPRISVNDFVIKAVGVALQRVPAMNVRWSDDAGEAVTNDFVDVSMAVAIEGGLITPIVTGAHARGLADIARVTKELVAKAKEGTLAPEEFEGGSFSVSNLGMFGISQFSAIINPPQSAILAVGGGIARAVMSDDGELQSVTQGVATLSSDARMIDEATAGKFLEEFTNCLTNPENLLL